MSNLCPVYITLKISFYERPDIFEEMPLASFSEALTSEACEALKENIIVLKRELDLNVGI